MRIVAGRHRGRTIAAPAGGALRPTADRVRENLYNILAHGRPSAGGTDILDGALVLDAFAGTGALGLEALSRGAAHVVFLDRDAAALDSIRRNLAALGETAHAALVTADATRPPARDQVRGNPAPRSLAFLDPPYRAGLAAPALEALAAAGWLAPAAIVVIELDYRDQFAPPAGFSALDARRYGRTRVVFVKWSAGDAPASS